MLIGAHVDSADRLAEAAARSADLVQFFLGDPQGWKAPRVAYAGGQEALRVAAQAAGVRLYVHAPYVINVATTNNRIRIPSRKLLTQHAEAAAAIGADGLIVHGGHVLAGDDPRVGVENWRKTFERADFPLPILVENTAGGGNAMARTLESYARLWDAIGAFPATGVCLDTCHAHAGGEDLTGLVERMTAITGRVDLVHANGSKDPFGSGRDRHENLATGTIDPDLVIAAVAAAGAPVVCETPGGAEGQAGDIAYLRARLPAGAAAASR